VNRCKTRLKFHKASHNIMIHATTKIEFRNLNYQLKNLLWKPRMLKKSLLKRIKSGMIFTN